MARTKGMPVVAAETIIETSPDMTVVVLAGTPGEAYGVLDGKVLVTWATALFSASKADPEGAPSVDTGWEMEVRPGALQYVPRRGSGLP
jgi:hypothetical protein